MTVTFHEDDQELLYINLNSNEQGVAFVQTVRECFEGYTKQDVKKAIAVRNASTMLGCQSEIGTRDRIPSKWQRS